MLTGSTVANVFAQQEDLNFCSEISLDNKNNYEGLIYHTEKLYYIAAAHMGYKVNF